MNNTVDTSRMMQVEAVLEKFLQLTGAKAVYVCDRGGYIVSQKATAPVPLEDNLAALCAGAFMATTQIARMIGEQEFDTLSQLGKNEGFFVHSIDGETLLLVFFDLNTTAGLVKFHSRQTIKEIMEMVAAADEPAPMEDRPVFELQEGQEAFKRITPTG